MHLYWHGAFDATERELIVARRLDPLYVNSRAHMINLRIVQGRIDEAEAELAAMRDIAPASLAANGLAAVLLLARGDARAAGEIYESLCTLHSDHPGCFLALAAARAAAGDLAGADALTAETLERFSDRVISPYVLAIVATRTKRSDAAFAFLRRAIDERDPSVLELTFDISFANLHDDPRWPTLVDLLRSRRLRRRGTATA
ncbi:MAG: hypothetical protein ABI641_11510 [Caldimonas sp.]